jgi:Rap1a immunity proteins
MLGAGVEELSGGNMGRRHAIGIAAVLGLLSQQSASAQVQDTGSADYVIVGCRDGMSGENRQPFRQGLCGGIVQTILYFGRTSFNVCIADGVTMGQAIRVVVAYIDQRPERMHERFETLALEVLQQSWPCQKVGGGRAQIAPSTPGQGTR